MKKMITAFFCAIFFLNTFSTSVSAQEKERIVKVGYYDFDGFSLPDQNGGITGYADDYLREIASYTGWSYEYVPGTLEECLNRLAAGEVDLVGGLQYTDERAELYGYSDFELGTEYAMLLVPKDDKTVYYGDYKAFNMMRIGFLRKTIQSVEMKRYAKEHGFYYGQVWFDNTADLQDALNKGIVNAILIGSLQRNTDLKVAAKFMPEPYYFITSKSDPELLNQLDNAMENIQTADVNYNTKLYNKYYGESFSKQVAFTREEANYIASHPRLRVVYSDSWIPIFYLNEEKGICDGVSEGILQLLSTRSGIQFEFIRASSETEAMEIFKRGDADLLCGFPTGYDDVAEAQGISLTKSFYQVPVMLATLPGVTLEDIKIITVPEGSGALKQYAEKLYPQYEIKVMEDIHACIDAVRRGQAQAMLENIYLLDQNVRSNIALTPEPLQSTRVSLPLSLGVKLHADPALRTLLNKLIFQLSQEDLNEVVVRNTMEGSHIDQWNLIRGFGVPFLVAVFFLILAIVLRSRSRIEKYAFADPLTGHGNKTKFMLAAQKLLGGKDPSNYAAVSLDIDKFKLINNMHGFDVGNRILKDASEIIEREMGHGELFCRESDDRFDLLLQFRSRDETGRRIEGLLQRITEAPRAIGGSFQYTMSCGIYPLQKTDKDIYRAVEWANLARGNAKKHRKNWIIWYDDSIRQRIIEEQDIENRMDTALMNGEFQVYYQPKIQLIDGTLAGAEALTRWQPKNRDMLYPDQFIPVFESNGFIMKLDLFVFEQVCRQLRDWKQRGFAPCPVSVNLSRVHLSNPNFHMSYMEILNRYDLEPNLLEIELTESMIFENITQMSSVVDIFKKAKFKVSVDDFGAGYSSLNLLKDLSFDYLKMDKEFLNTASVTERGKKVILSTKYLADQLDMILLAEGVETNQQVEFLRSIGCSLVQGYYFSKPLPLDEFEKYAGWV